MGQQPLFSGLVFDENGHSVSSTCVGSEPFYVVDDEGFLRHIPSQDVDRQVLGMMKQMIEENKDLLTSETAKMLGQEDIFTKAAIANQLNHIDHQFDELLQKGIPEEGRAYMGMMGFKVVINLHGEVLKVEQPGKVIDEDGE
jgi:hypothetical protein